MKRHDLKNDSFDTTPYDEDYIIYLWCQLKEWGSYEHPNVNKNMKKWISEGMSMAEWTLSAIIHAFNKEGWEIPGLTDLINGKGDMWSHANQPIFTERRKDYLKKHLNHTETPKPATVACVAPSPADEQSTDQEETTSHTALKTDHEGIPAGEGSTGRERIENLKAKLAGEAKDVEIKTQDNDLEELGDFLDDIVIETTRLIGELDKLRIRASALSIKVNAKKPLQWLR